MDFPRAKVRRVATQLVVIVFSVAALAWLWSALAAIANFAFRYPAFDQFRLYPIYLGLPFPDNVIQLENGHRPVLPALIRVAEILWFKADQNLQIVVGAGSAIAATVFLITTIARERAMPAVTRAAAGLLVVIAVFWLGNARMLMHGNELVHAYFVVLFAVLAFLCVSKARQGNERSWAAVAAVCCCAATFSFGTGAATFLAVLVLATVARLRLASVAIVLTAFVASMAVYLTGLPGDKGVRNTLLLDPAGNLSVLARWLAAPWMRAWLGHGEPSIEPWLQGSMSANPLGKVLVATASWISSPLGADAAMRIAAVVGTCGVVAYTTALIHAWRRPESMTTTRVVALGLSTFGIGAAVIVCLARLHLFEHSPGQIFADRYLPWSCLFWLGLALYPIASNRITLARTWGVPCATVVIAAMFLPSHRSLAGWSATVSRHIQQSAVAAQLGIWDPARFEDPAAPSDDVVKSLALLKQRRLSMFAEQGFSFVSEPWQAPAPGPALDGAYAHVSREFEDPHSHRRIADFEGWMPRMDGVPDDPVLLVIDSNDTLRGLAKLSFIGPQKKSLRFNIARKRGFDGYVLDAAPGEQLSICIAGADARCAGRIPLSIRPPRLDSVAGMFARAQPRRGVRRSGMR